MGTILAALLTVGSAARCAAPEPTIYPRSAWTSDPSQADEPDPKKVRIIVHHSAELVTDEMKKLRGAESLKAAAGAIYHDYLLHTRVNGWADIGYHYMIDWEGRIFAARPVEMLGAHAESANPGSVGICLLGNLQEQRPTAAQLASLQALSAWLADLYGISPEHIGGHHHYDATQCPGRYLEDDKDPDTPLRRIRLALIEQRRRADFFALQRRRFDALSPALAARWDGALKAP